MYRPIVRDAPICVCNALIYNVGNTLIHIILDPPISVRDTLIYVRDALIHNVCETLIRNVQSL